MTKTKEDNKQTKLYYKDKNQTKNLQGLKQKKCINAEFNNIFKPRECPLIDYYFKQLLDIWNNTQ